MTQINYKLYLLYRNALIYSLKCYVSVSVRWIKGKVDIIIILKTYAAYCAWVFLKSYQGLVKEK